MITAKPSSVDQYIASFPEEVQNTLTLIRRTIRKLVPEATETISYGIPTFKLNGHYLIYFAGYKKHISIYPAPRENEKFKEELSEYKGGKGTVQFALDKPIPLDLVKRIVTFRKGECIKKKQSKV